MNNSTHTLGVIGAGNMGMAILRGALKEGVLPPERVLVIDTDPAKQREPAELGCHLTNDLADLVKCEQLMLAVKPQSFDALATDLGALRESTIIQSIMAGIASSHIRAALGGVSRVIRIMPNTPAQIGQGMSAIALGEGAQAGDEALTRKVYAAIGKVVMIPESQMNQITAVSGSGPAYVFRLAEAMERAGLALGLDAALVRQSVIQTIHGAGALMCVRDDTSPSQLREEVTSRGGTTAAALAVMDQIDIDQMMVQAMFAARDRGIELGE